MEPTSPSTPHDPVVPAQPGRPRPSGWPDDDAELQRVQLGQQIVTRAHDRLLLPIPVWLLGTPICLAFAAYSYLFNGAVAFLALLCAVACYVGARIAGVLLSRRAESDRAQAWYALGLALSIASPLYLVVWATER